MVGVFTFIILSIIFLIFLKSRWLWSLRQARQKGLYPPKEDATMFDVRRLIVMKEKELAIRLYCEIFETNTHEATKAVNELEKSIEEKKLDH